MTKEKISDKSKIKKPQKEIEIKHPADPEEPLDIPDDDPDSIPEDDPYENSPAFEKPTSGEGP